MAYEISAECILCGACESECPVEAIKMGSDIYVIESSECTDCGVCVDLCPVGAIRKIAR